MFLTLENIAGLAFIFIALGAFIGYRCGKSDGIYHYVRSGYAPKGRD